MDEGTRAIIKEIAREINDIHYEKIGRITKEQNDHLDRKFAKLEDQVEEVDNKINIVGNTVNEIKAKNCVVCLSHVADHKEKEKRTIRNVTIISTSIPTIILLGSWIKGIIIGWIQKPHN